MTARRAAAPQRSPAARVGSDRARRLIVVFGDQLDASRGPLADLDKANDLVLMTEVADESAYVPSHKHRTALFLSAMRHFAADLRDSGVRVRYAALDDPANTHTFDGELRRAVADHAPEQIHLVHPGDYRTLHTAHAWRDDHALPDVHIHEDEHFLTTIDQFRTWARGRKELTMEFFYREQRKRLNILMEPDGKTPVGGAWNFDKDNRDAFKSTPRVPKPVAFPPDAITTEVLDLVQRRFPTNPGTIDGFNWPVTRDDATRALKDFIAKRLPLFGKYEDAMWTGERALYHSLLSSSGNLKLLDPRDAVAAAVDAHARGKAPLNAVEGFVRQWIGWREFIRGVYWQQGPDYPARNGLNQTGRLPTFFWTADTDMTCMRDCLASVVDTAYAHHIPRLMVIGNFAMIAGVHPREVADWFLAMFVDAVDWASNPNTIGMSQHADHGVVGTKPYAASGKYIQRMSNYCEHCRYNVTQRTGDTACPFNTFYWDFLIRFEETFARNHRMAMVVKNVEKMNPAERVEITSSAAALRARMGISRA